MNFYVSDTHALFWYLINSPALGVNARLAFDEADAGQALIHTYHKDGTDWNASFISALALK